MATDVTPSTTPRARRLRRFLIPVTLVLLIALLMRANADTAVTQDWLATAGPAAPVGFIAAGVLLMSCFVPKTAMSVSAGMLFGTWMGGCLLTLIAVIAAALNFAIGRCWLRRSLDDHLSRRRDGLASELQQKSADAGFGVHLLLRLSPLPTTVVSYSMGASGARFRPFIAAALIGAAPQWLWVHSGAATASAGAAPDSTTRWVVAAMSMSAALVISLLVSRTARRWIKRTAVEAPAAPHAS